MSRANWVVVLAAGGLVAGAAHAAGSSVSHVNSSIEIAAGQSAGDLSTVNGSIEVAARASVEDISTVNGGIELGAGATAKSATTVNGEVSLAQDARVAGDVRSVNGELSVETSATVGGSLTNVNGDISVTGGHVVGRIRTVAGSMELTKGARIDGGILVEKPSGNWFSGKPKVPRIVIGPGVSVGGMLKFEREVQLYVSDRAGSIGPITGATPIKFSGDTAPH